MIKIDLNLFVTLARYSPENSECLEINDHTTVNQLMSDLGIPGELVKLIFVNGRRQEKTYQLKQNDRVGLFPPIGGG